MTHTRLTIFEILISADNVKKILAHLDKKYPVSAHANLSPPLRAPRELETEQQDFDWLGSVTI